ncbi:hypothetical protein E6H23_06965 [Candidatus Bathyarchaeota archaeon]|nr:MAG: hypothetical protein E6H23_06965 [Candidatus Bathyarchaeota archaeon]
MSQDSIPFVSQIISRKVISEFGEPRLLIPIYSNSSLTRFPFLQKHGLVPLRVGIGTAVLTKAKLFVPIPETVDRTVIVTVGRKDIPASLLVKISTEAKYLSLAFETGVFKAAFDLPDSTRITHGIFGKMNLPKADILLKDKQGAIFPVNLQNVQLDLDYCIETATDVYLFEAKTDASRSFILL